VAEALNIEAGLPPGTTWLSCAATKMAMVVLTCPPKPDPQVVLE